MCKCHTRSSTRRISATPHHADTRRPRAQSHGRALPGIRSPTAITGLTSRSISPWLGRRSGYAFGSRVAPHGGAARRDGEPETTRNRRHGVLKDGGRRRRVTIDELVEGLAGKVEAFYFAVGEHHVSVISRSCRRL